MIVVEMTKPDGKDDDLSARLEAAERANIDYVIEFGRYLAHEAESFMAEQNRAWEAKQIPNKEHWSTLESAIHEFRKRANRAEATCKLVRRLASQQRQREKIYDYLRS